MGHLTIPLLNPAYCLSFSQAIYTVGAVMQMFE